MNEPFFSTWGIDFKRQNENSTLSARKLDSFAFPNGHRLILCVHQRMARAFLANFHVISRTFADMGAQYSARTEKREVVKHTTFVRLFRRACVGQISSFTLFVLFALFGVLRVLESRQIRAGHSNGRQRESGNDVTEMKREEINK